MKQSQPPFSYWVNVGMTLLCSFFWFGPYLHNETALDFCGHVIIIIISKQLLCQCFIQMQKKNYLWLMVYFHKFYLLTDSGCFFFCPTQAELLITSRFTLSLIVFLGFLLGKLAQQEANTWGNVSLSSFFQLLISLYSFTFIQIGFLIWPYTILISGDLKMLLLD